MQPHPVQPKSWRKVKVSWRKVKEVAEVLGINKATVKTRIFYARVSMFDFASVSAASNDQCEQFNHADSYHQHCECYRIVIEPMPPLHIHDTPPSLPISAFRAARRVQRDAEA
jgi:hypothetical protein